MDHERYMRRATGITRGNPNAPFGCGIAETGSGEILSEGLIDAEKSPTLRGETAAIGVPIERRPEPKTSRLVLHTTAGPCTTCSGAILWSGILGLAYGTSISALKRMGLPQIDPPCKEVADRSPFGGFAVTGGVMAAEGGALFGEVARRADGS